MLKDMESGDVVELNIKNSSAHNKELAVLFARQFASMDEETSKELLEFLRRKQNSSFCTEVTKYA